MQSVARRAGCAARPLRQMAPLRSVAVRYVSDRSVEQFIKEDHNKVRNHFSNYKSASDNNTKQQIAYEIIRDMSMHASKEEEVLYPVIAKRFGEDAANRDLDEHKKLKYLLQDLSSMDIEKDGQSAFDNQISKVEDIFSQHVTHEENEELPKLNKMEGVDVMALGDEFQKAEEHAVTRPHPWAPDRAPANWFSNRLTAPLDRAADAIRFGFQQQKNERNM